MSKDKTKEQEVLKLAGKLALAARFVTTSNAKNLSERIEFLENTLNEYDKKVMEVSNL